MDWAEIGDLAKTLGVGATILLILVVLFYIVTRVVIKSLAKNLNDYTKQGLTQNDEVVKHLITQNEKHEERMTKRDEIHEQRMREQEERFVKALDKNSTVLEKVVDKIAFIDNRAVSISETSLASHDVIINKVDGLYSECRGVKGSVSSIHDHLVAKMNELQDSWGKTREEIRRCVHE